MPVLKKLGGHTQDRTARALLKKGDKMPAFACDCLGHIERYASDVSRAILDAGNLADRSGYR